MGQLDTPPLVVPPSQTVWLLWVVTQDQYGKTELAGVFSARYRAEFAQRFIHNYQSYIKMAVLDEAKKELIR
jgi:hypothetical protein